ncbi:MAG: hypothetical protein KJT01_07960 [Gemmatimonadetes bacterium]|nr:hypothetical protein [Gemmatimonadota bacterium]
MPSLRLLLLSLPLLAACRADQRSGATAPLPEPPLPRVRLVMTPDTGTLVTASLVLGDGAALSVGAFTATVEFDPAVLTPVDWVAAPGSLLQGSDRGGALRLAGIHAAGVAGAEPLAVVRFAWPRRTPNAAPPATLAVSELADPEGGSLLAKVRIERGASWR